MKDKVESSIMKAMDGKLLDKQDIVNLLELPSQSQEVKLLGALARSISKSVADNRGKIWAAIGLDYASCKMNCSFCSLGEEWNSTRKYYELEEDEVMKITEAFIENGVNWLVIRTTEFYDFDKLIYYARKIKNILPEDVVFTVNTGDDNSRRSKELKDAGFDMVYQTIRLREGVDTDFSIDDRKETLGKITDSGMILSQYLEPIGPEHTSEEIAERILAIVEEKGVDTDFSLEDRRETLGKITDSGMILSQYLEPIGPEHTSEEIAERILAIVEEKTTVAGVMKRVSVKGTPKFEFGDLDEERLAHIVAVMRIATRGHIEDIIIHPYSKKALDCGANAIVVDIGAIPRSPKMELKEWNSIDAEKAKMLLVDSGYYVQ